MADISITLEVNNTDLVKEALQSAIDKALEEIGLQAQNYATAICPVDTGRLKNSITHMQENENTEVIGTNVEYAPYVEMGHHTASGSYVAPQPFLEPAVMEHVDEYKQMVMECLQNG